MSFGDVNDAYLACLGWRAEDTDAFAPHAARGLVPARVVLDHGRVYRVLGSFGERSAQVSGNLARQLAEELHRPAVGDWVAVRQEGETVPQEGETVQIEAVLPRRSCLVRRAAWTHASAQVLAANVDLALVMMAADRDFNLRRLDRYLAMIWEGGVQPVVLLSKADLFPDIRLLEHAVRDRAPGVPVLAVSSIRGEGMGEVRRLLAPGTTTVVLGSSGVGKSTLINTLLGEERLRVAEVRQRDRRGRHTTVQRCLVVLPDGGVIIDTPGLRELVPWQGDEGIGRAFADIEELAARCRFRDCRHTEMMRNGVEEST